MRSMPLDLEMFVEMYVSEMEQYGSHSFIHGVELASN